MSATRVMTYINITTGEFTNATSEEIWAAFDATADREVAGV